MIWAVALSLLSAGGYAVAAVVQERLAAAGHHGLVRWFWAILLTGVGAGLHVGALNFGTVGVVQALGTLTLILALPVAAIRRRASISSSAWRDACLTVAGLAAFLALTAEPAGPAVFTDDVGRDLAGGAAVVVTALALAAWYASAPLVRSLLLAGASGAAFAMASVYTKAVITSFSVPMAGVVAVFAIGGYLLSQLSYKDAGLAAPLAMVSVANPVVATVVGVLALNEGFRFGTFGLVLASMAGAVAGFGVVGLSRQQAQVADIADIAEVAARERAEVAEVAAKVRAARERAVVAAKERAGITGKEQAGADAAEGGDGGAEDDEVVTVPAKPRPPLHA